jgi:hypothetical protein
VIEYRYGHLHHRSPPTGHRGGVEARVLDVEVRPYAPDLAGFDHEFRVVGG